MNVIDPENIIETERFILRNINPEEYLKVSDYYFRNQEHFKNSIPDLPENFYSPAYQIEALWNEFNLLMESRLTRLFVFDKKDEVYDNIIADISLSNIIFGALSSCVLGFKTDKNMLNQSVMSECLNHVIKYVFDELKLHRIEAYVLPENEISQHILKKYSFNYEGICFGYLRLGGFWRDHYRFSLLNESLQI